MVNRLDHVAIAVSSIEEALPLYRDILGFELQGEEDVPSQRVRVAVLHAGATRVELLEPTAPDSPVARFIEKKGGGLHHIAVGVTDLAAALEGLAGDGVPLIDREPREGAEGARIAFLHPKGSGGVLVELVER
jgi:methylmalonyl-CoA/ethylmalonyl-CoA epimerase